MLMWAVSQSVRWYVSQLEKTVIAVCRRFGIEASTSPHTGVWVGENKICAIGTTSLTYTSTPHLPVTLTTSADWFYWFQQGLCESVSRQESTAAATSRPTAWPSTVTPTCPGLDTLSPVESRTRA